MTEAFVCARRLVVQQLFIFLKALCAHASAYGEGKTDKAAIKPDPFFKYLRNGIQSEN